jgi:RNA polymerase sigma factor (sigma-70 family)
MQKPTDEAVLSEDLLVAVYDSLLRYWIKQRVPLEKAEDLAQEGVLRCLLKACKWEGRASIKTFLVTVGRNAGYDLLRKEARQERIKQRSAETDRSPTQSGL